MLLARPARLRLSLSAAALMGLGGLAAAQDAVDPGLPLDAGYEGIAGEGEFPLLLGSAREGAAPATVRMIRGGQVVAAGTLDETGGLETGALPPGVYSVAGEAGGGRALFAYKITEGDVSTTDAAPLRLVAPASDWPVARAILMRRFPQLAAPVPTPGPATAPAPAAPIGGLTPPPAALPAPAPVRTISKVTVARRMGGVRPGSRGLVTQFDAEGVARPIVGADIYLIRAGERVAETRTDDGGLFTLPTTLGRGIHTLVTVSDDPDGVRGTLDATAVLRGNATRMAGASVVGLDIDAAAPVPAAAPAVPAADPAVPVVRAADGFVRPAALRAVQGGADFAVAQVPAADLGFALPVGPDGDDPGLAGPPPFGPAGGPGGFGGGLGGGGLGGGGGAAGGGGLLGALAIGGIAAGVIAAVSDDDEEPVAVADDPDALTPERPPSDP